MFCSQSNFKLDINIAPAAQFPTLLLHFKHIVNVVCFTAGKPQSGGASPTEQPLGLGQAVVAGLAEGLLDLGVVKVC